MLYKTTLFSLNSVIVFVLVFISEASFAGGCYSFNGYRSSYGYAGYYGRGFRGYGYGGSYYGRRGLRFGYGYGGLRPFRSYGYRNNRYYSGYNRDYGYSPNPYIPSAKYIVSSSRSGQNQNNDTNNSAWQLLISGQNSAALNAFARQAQNDPENGIPKAGYAMANASIGRLSKGVWAMRRAFRIAPDSLHDLRVDDENSVVDDVINLYKLDREQENANSDAAFMIASLSYIDRDYQSANQYAEIASAEGDSSESLTNLKQLINEQLSKI